MKLLATIEPRPLDIPVAVYIKVWDVDDPFDQIDPNMFDVGIMDVDASGPDKCPSAEQPWTATDRTGHEHAEVTFTVSLRPGNN